MRKKGKNIIERAVVLAIIALLLAGAFVPVSGFGITSVTLNTFSSETKDVDDQQDLRILKQMEEGFLKATIDYFSNNDFEQNTEKPLTPLDFSDPWWDSDWEYRKWITIDHTKVTESLLDFPMLLSISSDLNLSLYAQADGDDIVITDKVGNVLSYEIELFNKTIGQLVAWVKVPYLSSTVDTELYLYYGNETAENQENPSDVWDSYYVAVWHLSEDPGTAGTGGIKDSTSYNNHGTPLGSMDSADHVLSKIGYGIDFDGSNDVICIDNSASSGHVLDITSSPFTLEAWFYAHQYGTAQYGTLVSKRDNTNDQYQLYVDSTDSTNHVNFRASDPTYGGYGYGADTLVINTWYYAASVFNSTNYPNIYRDGVLKTWVNSHGIVPPWTLIHRDVDVSIGARWAGYPTTGFRFDGVIDEVRISKTERNSSWLSTTYNNYNDPNTFYTIVDEIQIDNLPPSITNETPSHNTMDVSCDFPAVSVLLNDTEGDLFNWTIQGTYINNAAGINEGNGTKTAPLITPLPPGTPIHWYINATDSGSNKWTNKTYTFTTGYPWWSDDWKYRRPITLDHTKVSANQTNFPVLLNILNHTIGYRAQTDGDDFIFTDKNGNPLSHEIELYNSTTGNLIVWVNVTNLSSTQDTLLFLYYGNPTSENQQNPMGVWDAHYIAVWHLAENPEVVGAGGIKDSTVYENHGTPLGGMNASDQIIGLLGYALDFDGSNDVIRIDNSNTPGHILDFTSGPFTIETWFRIRTTSDPGTLVNKRDSIGTTHYDQYQLYLQPQLRVRANAEYGYASDTVAANTWHYGVLVVNDTGWPEIYRNGVLKTTWNDVAGSPPYDFIHRNVNVSIGARWENYPTTAFPFKGIIDEVRISNIKRSSDWQITAFNNYNYPSTFSLIGAAESIIGFPPTFSNEQPQNNTSDIPITQETVSVVITDENDDWFDWTIEGQYVTSASGDDEGSGMKTADLIAPLPYITDIIWYVNATNDGEHYTRAIYSFTTRLQFIPVAPSDFIATAMNRTCVDLSWVKGVQSDRTYIERSLVSSWNRGEGTVVYNDSGTGYEDSGLSMNVQYYYQAWSWNETDAVFSVLSALADATTFENKLPVFSEETPVDDSKDIAIMYPSVSVFISDPEGDLLDWTIEGQYVTSASANDDGNGTKTANLITPLPYLTDIIWFVNATDGYDWTREIYNFTVRAEYIPESPSGFMAIPISRTCIDLSWVKGEKSDRTYIERSLVSSWNRGEGTMVYNDSGTGYEDSGLSMNVQYYYQAWSWNETDAVFSVLSASADATTFENLLPGFSNENPTNNTVSIPITTSSVSVMIQDQEGDLLDWTIEGPYVTSASANDDGNGTKTANLITPLPYDTTIIWYVNATDGYGWTRTFYTFTTVSSSASYPTVTLTAPANNSLLHHNDVTFNCSITDTTGIQNVSLYTNISGTWEVMQTITPPGYEYPYHPLMELWMHFNKDSAYGETDTHLYDFSGKEHNGTAINGAAYTSEGKYGGAYSFDGVNDVIQLTSGNYSLPGKTGATMAAWVNPAAGQTSVAGTILYIDRAGTTFTRMLIAVNNDQTVAVKGRSDDETFQVCISTQTIPYDTWSHIVGVINLTSNTMQIYINGILSKTQTMAFKQNFFATSTATNPGIGGIAGATGTTYYFKGLIDETTMIPRALNASEIQALYYGRIPTSYNASFSVNDIPSGTYQWNCIAYNTNNSFAWALDNWKFTVANHPPSFSNETPANNTGNASIDTYSVSILIQDQDGDLFDWTIEGPYVTSASANNDGNGTKIATLITPLPYNTSIIWYVNATDGYGWTRAIYNFTTFTPSAGYPTVTLTTPLNNSLIDNTQVIFNCTVTDDISVKNVSLYTNIGGTWQLKETKDIYGGEYNYDPSMELWMHFNKDPAYGETETHIYDFSGKNHNGTATDGAAFSTDGKYGGAYTFDGDNDVIRLPSSNYGFDGETGATMAAWVKPASGQVDYAGTIIFIDTGAAMTSARMLISVNNDRTVSVKARSNLESPLPTLTTTQTIPVDTWTHIVGIVNLTSDTAFIYINGQLSISGTLPLVDPTFATTSSVNGGIGGIYTSTTYSYKGMIDESALFLRVLSESEVQALYNGSKPTSCDVSFTVMDIPEGTHEWNCLAYNDRGYSSWADQNWTFTILSPLTIQFVPPTPSDGEILYTQTATINVSSNRNLSSSILTLLHDGVNNQSFTISLSQSMVDKWGFKYPVTYIFNLSSIPTNAEVVYRTHLTDPWRHLIQKTEHDFFNGIECVRFNSTTNQAFVSVGFNTTDTIYLKFLNVSAVTYYSIAKYYDNRKATYTLSNDNWGRTSTANPGATWQGMTNDASDKYQAAVHATRMFNIPMSIAINSQMAGGTSMWARMQEELNYLDYSWEPTVHTRTHPCSSSAYLVNGYAWEILGCRDDILGNLANIPFGPYVFEFILPCGYKDTTIQSTSAGEFLFLRDWTGSDHPSSTIYAPWNSVYNFYGIGGLETKAYDVVFQSRSPAGRYYASDVANLNNAFMTVYNNGGIFYAMFHSDRYSNSVIYDPSPGVDGVSGSSLMQHLSYIANWTEVWYVANGWLYSYRYVAENAAVSGGQMNFTDIPMTVVNNDENTYAYLTLTELANGTVYYYYVTANDTQGNLGRAPISPTLRSFRVSQPASWWNLQWAYRKEIIIDHSKVAGDLTYFPVLISSASDADLAGKTQPDGDDVVFTTYDGTKLSHEIELYNSTTGQLLAWINIPALSSTQDTILYLYYGNSACANQQDIPGTWGSHYRMVHHLNEATDNHVDSSIYGNDGTYHGSNQNAAGIIDGADQFIGDFGNVPGGDYIDCGNATSLNPTTAITVSSWIKPTADQINWNHLCTKGANSPNRVYQLSIEANETIDFIINGDTTNGKATTSVSVPINQWSYVIGTYDGSIIKVYINGIQQASKPYTNPINTNEVHLFIAGRVNGVGNTGDPIYTFNGLMDEVRVSDNAHSAEWILTEYNNQHDPSGFFQIGEEEQTPQMEYVYRIPVEPRWNLISMPFTTSEDKTELIIYYNETEYTWDEAVSSQIIIGTLYNWNGTSQSYNIKNTLEPGSGYWMWAYYPCELVISHDHLYQDGSVITVLKPRWNLMGLPYNTSLAKQNIIVHYNGSDYTWQQATTGATPIVLEFIYGWNRSTQMFTLSNQLDAGNGYWMYAYQECILKK